jgi:hypothetical protein
MVKIYIKSVAVGTSAPSGLVTISRSGDNDGCTGLGEVVEKT